ncbi:response regulator [Synechococcus sp. H70.2]|uniref:response regulator n=1 Tax=unclassified Synechococcus TaxID=2626047 RepID=UPI0039C3AA38
MSKRILVIEDEPAIRTYLQKVLQRAGYDTVAASNGEEGLQLVRALLPDLVLCDVVMPKLNGYAVLEAVRWDQATAHIPFVFLSSKTSREATEQGRQLGSNAYLTKPIDQSRLLRTIAAHLTSRGCP